MYFAFKKIISEFIVNRSCYSLKMLKALTIPILPSKSTHTHIYIAYLYDDRILYSRVEVGVAICYELGIS